MVIYSKNDSKKVFSCLKEKTSLFCSIVRNFIFLNETKIKKKLKVGRLQSFGGKR